MKTASERFWSKVEKTESCWLWLASKRLNGYGVFKDGKLFGAHRWAYADKAGQIPDGMCVLHRCDNRSCVNPAHLFLGTKKDNTLDMMAKGRNRHGPLKPQRGEQNNAASFTADDVLRMRELSAEKTQDEIAAMFCTTQQTVSKIVRGERWAHLHAL